MRSVQSINKIPTNPSGAQRHSGQTPEPDVNRLKIVMYFTQILRLTLCLFELSNDVQLKWKTQSST